VAAAAQQAPTAPIASSEPAPAAQPPAPAASAAPSAPPRGSAVEAEAREALSRLRAGILACVRDTIGILPGTSPPVPARFATLKVGAYTSAPRDWTTPVWNCAKFRQTAPQRFQIQWQMTKPGVEGMGIAWLDEDADGKAERALGFRATLKKKGSPEMGEIEIIDPSLPAAKPPR
jgi:hypothetical protein